MNATRPVNVWRGSGRPFAGVDYATRWRQILPGCGLEPVVRDYLDGSLGGASAGGLHLVVGSEIASSDARPQMRDFLSFVAEVVAAAAADEAALLGVCFGAQAIAAAVAGPASVRAAPKGIEAGVARVTQVGQARARNVAQFHYEEVDPAFISGVAKLEFTNAHSEVQGFVLGDRVRGVQFHPEFSADDARALLAHNADLIAARRQGAALAAGESPSADEARAFAADLLMRTFGLS